MFVLQSLSLLLPILAAGVFLIVAIKEKWFLGLNRAVDGGVKFGGRAIFGANKTWRGILIYIFGSMVACSILWIGVQDGQPWIHHVFGYNPVILGVIYGGSYCIGELVNSFAKRRLGVRPGESTGWLQYFIDTVDGMVASIVVLGLIYGANFVQLLIVMAAGVSLHMMTDVIMKKQKLKK